MIKDHVSGRKYIRDLATGTALYRKGDPSATQILLESARHYMTLLIQHIDIEDNVLYPLADARLTGEKQAELLEDFDRLEVKEIGEGKHEEFHRTIEKLKGIYLDNHSN